MENQQDADVIVVGAGPSGAATATILAQKGYDVLLLDRNLFPRDKACGDGIPAGAIEVLIDLGMKEKIKAAVKRGEFYPAKRLRLVSPKGNVLEADLKPGKRGGESYVAPRMFFDTVIQQHALESGARFTRADVKEPLLEDGRVVGVRARQNGELTDLKAKVVIGADGVTSAIARHLRPKPEQHSDHHRAVALRAYIEDLEENPNEVEFYLYKDILPGYAWIFNMGEHRANIGLGMRLDHFRKIKGNLKKMLGQFMDMPEIKKRLLNGGQLHDIAIWQLNFGSQKHLQHSYDGALLVGDAAGFINPLTGGGIYNGLVSAELAAQTVDEALQEGDTSRQTLQIYEQRVEDTLWDGMKRSYFIQRWLLRFPFIVDFLISHVKENSTLAQIFLSKL